MSFCSPGEHSLPQKGNLQLVNDKPFLSPGSIQCQTRKVVLEQTWWCKPVLWTHLLDLSCPSLYGTRAQDCFPGPPVFFLSHCSPQALMDLAALRLLLASRYRAKSVSCKRLMFSSERESLTRFAENWSGKLPLVLCSFIKLKEELRPLTQGLLVPRYPGWWGVGQRQGSIPGSLTVLLL